MDLLDERPVPPPPGELLEALQRLHGTGPEFHGFLANHGPMASEALVRLGETSTVLRWVDDYVDRLDDLPPATDPIDADGWREHLGDESRFADWTALLLRESQEMSWHDLLLRWWPRLLPGLAASATHGLIRTAHAVRSLRAAGDDPERVLVDELAHGLGFWAARFQTVPGDPALDGTQDAVAALAHLPRLDPDVDDEGPGIGGRLTALRHLDGLPAGLDRWLPGDHPLDEVISAAARVLAARDDAPIAFCHGVTAPASMHLVLPVLPDELQRASVAASWQVVGGIVAAFAVPRLPAESEQLVDVDVDGLVADLPGRAVEHGDEHVIKLTEAALREYDRRGDPMLLVAADRFRGRIPNDG